MEPHAKTTSFSMVEGGALNKLFDLLDERMLELPEIAEMLELLSYENSYLVRSQTDPSPAVLLGIVGEDPENISMVRPSTVPMRDILGHCVASNIRNMTKKYC